MTTTGVKPNGSLTTFLRKLDRGLKNGAVSVNCGDCAACCSDPRFEVDLTDAEAEKCQDKILKHGRWVLPKREDGTCINLENGSCRIYTDRPRTCRVYDCRYHLFGAPLHPDCKVVRQAVERWEPFSLPTMEDKVAMVAITVMLAMTKEKDPDLKGLAYILLQWKNFRKQAYDFVQEMQGT